MSVLELSVQIKNIPGQLTQLTAVLAEANISLLGIAASSAGKSGWVRLVVDNTKIAAEALEDCGFDIETSEAVAIQIAPTADHLDTALRVLSEARINIDYIYTCTVPAPDSTIIILGTQSPSKAESLLAKAHITIAAIKN